MDEPFSALDTETRARLGDDLLRLWRAEMKTIVFVTHDPIEAVRLADRIVVLSSRPAKVVREIAIFMPRPRSIDMPDVAEVVRDVEREIAAQTARAREEDEDAYARAERAGDAGRAAFVGSGI
jgi:NitT/TauT family transport system ATP-binding protein